MHRIHYLQAGYSTLRPFFFQYSLRCGEVELLSDTFRLLPAFKSVGECGCHKCFEEVQSEANVAYGDVKLIGHTDVVNRAFSASHVFLARSRLGVNQEVPSICISSRISGQDNFAVDIDRDSAIYYFLRLPQRCGP